MAPSTPKPQRWLLLTLGVGAVIVLLGWLGGFLFWHIRLNQATKAWEKDPKVTPTRWDTIYGPEEVNSLMASAGCRALPHLINALDESKNPNFLEGITYRIALCVGNEDFIAETYPTKKEWAVASEQLFVDWKIEEGDTPDVRRRKIAAIREWWGRNGTRYHQWWRFWSSSCLVAR